MCGYWSTCSFGPELYAPGELIAALSYSQVIMYVWYSPTVSSFYPSSSPSNLIQLLSYSDIGPVLMMLVTVAPLTASPMGSAKTFSRKSSQRQITFVRIMEAKNITVIE